MSQSAGDDFPPTQQMEQELSIKCEIKMEVPGKLNKSRLGQRFVQQCVVLLKPNASRLHIFTFPLQLSLQK